MRGFKAGFVIVKRAYEKKNLDIQYINVLGVTYFDEVYDTKFGLPFITVEIHLYIQFKIWDSKFLQSN